MCRSCFEMSSTVVAVSSVRIKAYPQGNLRTGFPLTRWTKQHLRSLGMGEPFRDTTHIHRLTAHHLFTVLYSDGFLRSWFPLLAWRDILAWLSDDTIGRGGLAGRRLSGGTSYCILGSRSDRFGVVGDLFPLS